MDRRGFLRGLIAAPAVILTPNLLMPVRRLELFPSKIAGNPSWGEVVTQTLQYRRLNFARAVMANNMLYHELRRKSSK